MSLTKSTTSNRPEGSTRYDHFQMLRGVACSMVLLNHVAGYLSIPLHTRKDAWFAPLLVPLGFPWVWLFLVLSGFLLTRAFVNKRFDLSLAGIGAFYVKRARRLLPLIWFVSVLWGLLYFLRIWSNSLPSFDLQREFGIALAVPWVPYFESTQAIASVNSPIWSAVIEVHYCILMPFVLLAARLRRTRMIGVLFLWIAAMALLATSVVFTGEPAIFPLIYGAHIYNAGFFVAGMVLALGNKGYSFVKTIPWPIVLSIVGISVIGTQYLSYHSLNAALAVLPLVWLPVWCLLVARADDQYQSDLPVSLHQIWGGGQSASLAPALGHHELLHIRRSQADVVHPHRLAQSRVAGAGLRKLLSRGCPSFSGATADICTAQHRNRDAVSARILARNSVDCEPKV